MRCRLVFVPSLFRQELILYLKKAKAVCGSAGFRGKQIPDVVKCVEDLVELEVLLIFPYLHSANINQKHGYWRIFAAGHNNLLWTEICQLLCYVWNWKNDMVDTTATIHHYDKYAVFCLNQQRMEVYFTIIVYGHCDAFVLFFSFCVS